MRIALPSAVLLFAAITTAPPAFADETVRVERVTVPRVAVQRVQVPSVVVPTTSVQTPSASVPDVPSVVVPHGAVQGVTVSAASVPRTFIPSHARLQSHVPGAAPAAGSGTYFSTRTTDALPVALTVAPVHGEKAPEVPVSSLAGRPVTPDTAVTLAPAVRARPRATSPRSLELWRAAPPVAGEDSAF